jgi:hypothetical protein
MCLPSKLLRAELLKRDFLWRDEEVVSFVDGALNGCCKEKDALEQVQKWKLQKLGADARARGRQRQQSAAAGGGGQRAGGQEGQGPRVGRRVEDSRGGQGGAPAQKLYSAFAAPLDWAGQDKAAADDLEFWLAVDKGFQRGSRKQVVLVTWLSLRQSDSGWSYMAEGENEEPVRTRFLSDVKLEGNGEGFCLSETERIRVQLALEQHKNNRATYSGNEQETAGFDECTSCAKYNGEEDVQVLCDRCDQGWHLECLNEMGVLVPDDVLHPEVTWYCRECKEEEEDEIATAIAKESVAEQDIIRRASRVGRVVRVPQRFTD